MEALNRLSGLLSERPDASTVIDAVYYCTDENKAYVSVGADWVDRPNPSSLAVFTDRSSVPTVGSLPPSDENIGWVFKVIDTDKWFEAFPDGWLEITIGGGGGGEGGGMDPGDIDTLAELNAILQDATLGDQGDFATAAQGAKADTATQPGDLGTAAASNVGDFATAAQGAKADTATQPGDLGTAAPLDVGTGANQVVQLDGTSKLPAVDGSQLTNLPGGGGLNNVVEDATPQLGGNLDAQNYLINDSAAVESINPTGRALTDSNSFQSLDWEYRKTRDSSVTESIDWEYRQLKDSTGTAILDWSDSLGYLWIGNFVFEAQQSVGAPEDDYVLTYDNATGRIKLEAAPGAGGGISNVVEDTTPQLGGALDANNQWINDTGSNNSIHPDGRWMYDSMSYLTLNWDYRWLYNSSEQGVLDWGNQNLVDSMGTDSIQWDARYLYDSSGYQSADYGQRRLYDTSGNYYTVDWNYRYLNNSSQMITVDWEYPALYDSMGSTSVAWSDREAFDSGGHSTLRWEYGYLYDSSSNVAAGWMDRVLYDSSSNGSIDWNNRLAQDSASYDSINWGYRRLLDTGSTTSVDWGNRALLDSGSYYIVDWGTQQLGDSFGNTALDWADATAVEIGLGKDLVFNEQSGASFASVAGKGQLWVKNDTPNKIYFTDDAGTDHDLTSGGVELGVAVGDETTDATTGTAKTTFRMPYAMTLTDVRASVTTAPTGAALQVDINENGVSVLSTVLSVDASEKTSETAATAAVISDSALADDAEITIDIDQIGSTVAGAGLKIWLIGTRT